MTNTETKQKTGIIKPINKQVLVDMGQRKEKSEGGIVLLEQSQKAENWGRIVGVGNKCELVKEGQKAFITDHQGTLYQFEGKDYVIIHEDKILMIDEA